MRRRSPGGPRWRVLDQRSSVGDRERESPESVGRKGPPEDGVSGPVDGTIRGVFTTRHSAYRALAPSLFRGRDVAQAAAHR